MVEIKTHIEGIVMVAHLVFIQKDKTFFTFVIGTYFFKGLARLATPKPVTPVSTRFLVTRTRRRSYPDNHDALPLGVIHEFLKPIKFLLQNRGQIGIRCVIHNFGCTDIAIPAMLPVERLPSAIILEHIVSRIKPAVRIDKFNESFRRPLPQKLWCTS